MILTTSLTDHLVRTTTDNEGWGIQVIDWNKRKVTHYSNFGTETEAREAHEEMCIRITGADER